MMYGNPRYTQPMSAPTTTPMDFSSREVKQQRYGGNSQQPFQFRQPPVNPFQQPQYGQQPMMGMYGQQPGRSPWLSRRDYRPQYGQQYSSPWMQQPQYQSQYGSQFMMQQPQYGQSMYNIPS